LIPRAYTGTEGAFGATHGATSKKVLLVMLACLFTACPFSAYAQDTAKSPGKASLLSLLLPGMGELYAGGPRSGRFFLFTEGMFWTGMAVFKSLEDSRTDTYGAHASAHAGIRLGGKSDRLIEEVGIYSSIYTRNARELYVSGEFADLRPETSDETWEWDSDASRYKFLTLRSNSTSAEQKAFLFVGALVFNRFASALNAASIARRTQASPPSNTVRVRSGVNPDGGARLDLWLSF
jgi:hypothetical protein